LIRDKNLDRMGNGESAGKTGVNTEIPCIKY